MSADFTSIIPRYWSAVSLQHNLPVEYVAPFSAAGAIHSVSIFVPLGTQGTMEYPACLFRTDNGVQSDILMLMFVLRNQYWNIYIIFSNANYLNPFK